MKAVSIILLVILLASFSLSATAAKEGRFGLGARQHPFFSDGSRFFTTVDGRYWWKEGIGIEGSIGVFTSGSLRAFYSGSLLFPFLRTNDADIYLSMGLHANGEKPYYNINQLFQLLRDILTLSTSCGGYHIGLGAEIVITENLTLDLRVEYYENTWSASTTAGAVGGVISGGGYRLAGGAGVIYYF